MMLGFTAFSANLPANTPWLATGVLYFSSGGEFCKSLFREGIPRILCIQRSVAIGIELNFGHCNSHPESSHWSFASLAANATVQAGKPAANTRKCVIELSHGLECSAPCAKSSCRVRSALCSSCPAQAAIHCRNGASPRPAGNALSSTNRRSNSVARMWFASRISNQSCPSALRTMSALASFSRISSSTS